MEKRLLVLDDEPEFGAIVREVGEDLGYAVTVLDQPEDFELAYKQVKPDTILLDIVMPRIDGIELTRWLIDEDCNSKVVLCSGYNPHYALAAATLAELSGNFPVVTLEKPVSLSDLSSALRHEEPAG